MGFSYVDRLLFAAATTLTLAGASQAAENWQIHKEDGRDYVSLENIASFYNLPGNIPPVSELTQVAANTPLTRKHLMKSGTAEVEVTTNSREVMINGVKHWLAFPTLVKDEKVLVSRLDLAKTFEPALRPQMIKGIESVRTIVLDAGHGGHDRGAICAYGMEKDFSLDVARRAKGFLETAGFKVVMTRDSDEFLPLQARPRVANGMEKVLFVSIHFNSSLENRFASGFEVFSLTPQGAPSTNDEKVTQRDMAPQPGNPMDLRSAILANSVHHALLGEVPQTDRGVKRARFAVLRLAKVPAVLIECGFVSNPYEARLISSATWRTKVAQAIVEGIESYQRLATSGIAPTLVAEYRKTKPSSVGLRDEPTVVTNARPELPPASN